MKTKTAVQIVLAVLAVLLGLSVVTAQDTSQAGAQAGGQAAGAAKAPAWKSREEYDAFTAMTKATDPNQQISAAEAFVQKYSSSDFKDQAYQVEMSDYQKLGNSAKAIDSARKAIAANPNNLDALRYLCFAFPYVYDPKTPNESQLTQAEQDAKQGLQALQNLQKPANATDDQFQTAVKALRSVFNTTLGFVYLQRKDAANAATYLQQATSDNPSDSLTFSLLGQADLQAKPPDFDKAIWYLARSVALAKAANTGNAPALQKFFEQVYVGRHGSDQGAQDVLSQAAANVNPPDGFKVAPPEKHAKTGNPAVDGFYDIEDTLRPGGDQAQQSFQQVKGQPLAMPGKVVSVDPLPGGGVAVKIAATPDSQQKDGVYDVELDDTTQPDAKYLKKGAQVPFKGTISAFSTTPSFYLTLIDGTITNEDILKAAAEDAKSGAKKPAPTHRRPRS